MINKAKEYRRHWRDVLVVMTTIFVFGSLVLVAYGINQNNRLATQSKQHIDCIIKDLSTPQPSGTTHKYIDYQTRLTSDCKIKFN